MFLGIVFVAAAFALVPLMGGKLGRLADLRFRSPEIGVAALALQGVVLGLLPHGNTEWQAVAHVASYGMMGVFVARNLAIPGLGIIAVGGALNAIAILANDGVMPADPEAVRKAGLEVPAGEFLNSRPIDDAPLGFLGDVFATPADWPLANVFSAGDVVLVIGLTWLVLRHCRTVPVRVLEHVFARASARRPRFTLLREQRTFRRLWFATFVSNVGDWIYPLAVFTAAVGAGGANATSLAFLIAAQVGPGMLVGLFGGPLIDRHDRRTVMIAADLTRLCSVGSLLLADQPSMLHLYAVAISLGVFGALFQPSLLASLPNIVPRSSLATANALVGMTFSTAIMLGPVLGALLVGAGGVKLGFAVNALSFAASALLVASTRIPRGDRRGEQRSLAVELAAGLDYMRGNRTVRGVLVLVALITMAAGIKAPLEPLLALRELDAGPTGYGLLGGFWGAGMAVGFVFAAVAVRRYGHGQVLTTAIAVVAVAVLTAAAMPVLWPILLFWLLAGAANSAGTVAYETLLLERTPDALRGRVMAAVEGALEAGLLVGVVSAGLVAELVGTRGGYVVSGAIFLCAALVAHRTFWIPRRADGPRLDGFDVVSASGSHALLRVRLTVTPESAPVLLVDDGSRVHRLAALPDQGGGAYGFGVPAALLKLRRAALAVELRPGDVVDLPRPASA